MTTPLYLRMAIIVSLFSGCVTDEDDWNPADSVTVANGVYGQTVARCPEVDVPCVQKPASNVPVAAYTGPDLPSEQSAPAATAVSDERGFFQLALPNGTYRLCRSDFTGDGAFVPSSCTGAPTAVGEIVRIDLY